MTDGRTLEDERRHLKGMEKKAHCPSEAWREKVARIIDPHAWSLWSDGTDAMRGDIIQGRKRVRAPSLAKADAIAALSPAPEGWRKIKALRGALAEIRTIVAFEFGEMKRKPEVIMDPLKHIGRIAEDVLSASPLPVGGGEERDSGSDVAADEAPVSEGRPTPQQETNS